ncbi:Lsr2 family protein [Streptomyces sp. UH6]|uniref:Lsr2 family DNA-binding protein n=1 Tax=Streptomyces sp. UH6 TaxID=2748379 RepID=UPI0015D50123|nr:Lsr2 family protein [Streptomyces sp. UH6]NYV72957.1 Lsr2 family protein [Streptomyces sp. UH6]
MTIHALRRLLDEIDAQGGPEAAREDRLRLTEGTSPMTTQTATTQASPGQPQTLPVGQLLAWGDQHSDPEVQAQAARARAALVGLRQRHAADQELTAITAEKDQLEKRLAELQARQDELQPTPAKKRRTPVVRDYDTREVRAWAAEAGIDCPKVGQIPRRVLDAWRQRPAA